MKNLKIETCQKENLYWKESIEKNFEKDTWGWEENIINIYPEITFQKIIGFGGAFTESAGYSLSLLPKEKREDAIFSYFSSKTLNYTLCRTTINSCDFSLNNYAYLNTTELKNFSIERDKKFLIPMIQNALQYNPSLTLLASPWSPPYFMKTNQNMNEGGKLLAEFKQLWANYLIRYVKEYKKNGISIDYMTIQNEPKAIQKWDSCIYTSKEEGELLRNYLYPTFLENRISMKFLIWDHNKERLVTRANEILEDGNTRESVSGIAFHWYSGDHFENIRILREKYPEMILLATEGCTGYSHFRNEDEIFNAEIYAHDYLENLNAGANGQIDWNLFLNHEGGPNHKQNYCNSPIMLDKSNKDIIKNLSYYYIGHFSRYLKPGAVRIGYSKYSDKIEVTAFQNPDESIIIIVLNRTDSEQEYVIRYQDNLCVNKIRAHSIITNILRK